MSYSVSGLGIEDLSIYRNPLVKNACETIMLSHRPSLELLGKKIITDWKKKPDEQEYRALLAEYMLSFMFESLGWQRGWDVYPITEEIETKSGKIFPKGIGNRLEINQRKGGKQRTEIDGLVLLQHHDSEVYVILEAKSGNYHVNDEFENQVIGFSNVTGIQPSYVMAVPKTHGYLCARERGKGRKFRSQGGILITFNESSDDFINEAKRMFEQENNGEK